MKIDHLINIIAYLCYNSSAQKALLPHGPNQGLVGEWQEKEGTVLYNGVITLVSFGFVFVLYLLLGKTAAKRHRQNLKIKAEFLDKFWAARKNSPLCYYNTRHEITVLVRADDYDQAGRDYRRGVEEDMIPRSQRIIIVVKPAFTFWTVPQARNFMQTGSDRDLSILQSQYFESIAGFTRDDMNKAVVKNWINNIDRRDLPGRVFKKAPNLFVPFSNGTIVPLDKQEAMFPAYNLEQVRAYLIDKTPLPT